MHGLAVTTRLRRSLAAPLALALLTTGAVVAVPRAARADIDSHAAVVPDRPSDRTVHAVDGQVSSVAQVGTKVVLGGTFTTVGPGLRGAAGRVDVAAKAFRPGLPDVVGAVLAVASDGAGGWFLGGRFSSVGGVARRNAAHVAADGTVTGWNPAPNADVLALAATTQAVFLGGTFTSLGATPAGRAARVDRTVGGVEWNGQVGAAVRALDLAPDGSRLFVGGDFVSVAGVAVKRLVALDPSTGARHTDFSAGGGTNYTVRTIEATASTVYVGGDFTTVGSAARKRIAALDAMTGTLRPFDGGGANATVFDLEVDPTATTLYVGGRFGTVGGAVRPRVAAVDAASGAVRSWRVPNVWGDVLALALDGTGGLHLGGNFVITPERSFPSVLARVAVADARVDAVVPAAALPRSLLRTPVTGTSAVYALSRAGGDLLVGGDFSDYGLTKRERLAAFDLATGALDAGFDPGVDGEVNVVKGSADGRSVYVGGAFTTAGGAAHRNLAKLDLATGQPVQAFEASTDSFVKDLAVAPDGRALYVGGAFEHVNGVPNAKLAAVDPTSGAPLAGFRVPLTEPTNDSTEGGVRALALTPDGRRLVVIGNFRKVAGLDRPLVAVVDVSGDTAAVTEWRTSVYEQPCSAGRVGKMRDVDVAPDGSTFYVVTSGHFYYPACDTLNAFSLVPATNAQPLWTAKIGDTIESVAATGGAVYIGGHFRYLEAETQTLPRFQVAAVDPRDGSALNWAPNADGFRGVMTIESEPAGVFLGTDGDIVGGVPHGRLALFPSADGGIDLRKRPDRAWVLSPGGTVRYTVTARNTLSDRSLTVTRLEDDRLGSLAGQGTCVLPQTIAAGGAYSCSVTESIAGTGGASVGATADVSANDGTRTYVDADRSTVQVLASAPGFRIRVSATPSAVTFPGADVLFSVTMMNLDLQRPADVSSLTSTVLGDLTSACRLPARIEPNKLLNCMLTRPVEGPVGTRPATDFTAKAALGGETLTSSESVSTTILAPAGGAKALLVVKDAAALDTAEVKVRDRLAKTFSVQVVGAAQATTEAATGASVVLIGPSADDPAAATRLRASGRPLVAVRPTVLDELGLVPTDASAQGSVTGLGYDIVRPLHPLAATRSGFVETLWEARPLSWGRPAAGAEVVGQIAPGQATLFSYAPGVPLADGTAAPACRVADPSLPWVLLRWNTTAWLLFDRAVTYAASGCGRSMVWTVAGNGTITYPGDGKAATAVGLNQPSGMVFDRAGNLYVADTGGHVVRRIDPQGVVTTVAGTGEAGWSGDGGPAVAAKMRGPMRLTFDAAGNLYIADVNDMRIRKVTPQGIISTVAGSGLGGYGGDGGLATKAHLYAPSDVAVDAAGNLYIADKSNHRIRRVGPDGIIRTVAGTGSPGYWGDDGPATAAGLRSPSGVALGSRGELYVADTDNERVRRIGADGTITTVAGTGVATASGDGGPAVEAGLHKPTHVLAGPSGELFVSELNNNRVRRIGSDGMIETYAGTGSFGFAGDGGPALQSTWNRPTATALDGRGVLYVADRLNYRVRAVAPG